MKEHLLSTDQKINPEESMRNNQKFFNSCSTYINRQKSLHVSSRNHKRNLRKRITFYIYIYFRSLFMICVKIVFHRKNNYRFSKKRSAESVGVFFFKKTFSK